MTMVPVEFNEPDPSKPASDLDRAKRLLKSAVKAAETLAEHIAEHDLPWGNIEGGYRTKLQVQLNGGSWHDLAGWVSTFDAAVWNVGDFRDTTKGDPSWFVHAVVDLDGDLDVWCSVPADFADTADAVQQRMVEAVAERKRERQSDEVLDRVNEAFAADLESALYGRPTT